MNVYFWLFLPLWLFAVFVSLYLIPHVIVRKACVGDLVVNEEEDKTVFSLEIDGDPYEIGKYKYVSFRVKEGTQDISPL